MGNFQEYSYTDNNESNYNTGFFENILKKSRSNLVEIFFFKYYIRLRLHIHPVHDLNIF